MNPPILLKGVEPVSTAKPLGSGRDHALRLLPQLDPGDMLSARVEAKLPDGTYRVLISGQALDLALPSHVAAGDTVELALVAREPRLSFVMRELPQAAAPAPLLSAAGRLVAATMLQSGELALPVASPASAPLISAPPADGGRLALALAQTLAESGLFYESHQADWVSGRRELAQMREEPQARLTRRAPARETGAAAAAAAAGETPSAAPAQREQQTIDPRTVSLVQQQLAALDTGRLVLQLEIWPKQWMQWEIDEHQQGAAREPDTPGRWMTTLRLELPRLGELTAALTLGDDAVLVRIEAASPDAVTLLEEHRPALQAALAAAALPRAGIAIAHRERS